MTESYPPGWYPDPQGAAGHRWWDGAQWTAHAAPGPAAAYPVAAYPVYADPTYSVAGYPAPVYPAFMVPVPAKSVGVAFVLTFLFGAFGLFYSSVVGGVVMLLVEFFLFLLGLVTFGLGWGLFAVAWVICIVWGCVAASAASRPQLVAPVVRR